MSLQRIEIQKDTPIIYKTMKVHFCVKLIYIF